MTAREARRDGDPTWRAVRAAAAAGVPVGVVLVGVVPAGAVPVAVVLAGAVPVAVVLAGAVPVGAVPAGEGTEAAEARASSPWSGIPDHL